MNTFLESDVLNGPASLQRPLRRARAVSDKQSRERPMSARSRHRRTNDDASSSLLNSLLANDARYGLFTTPDALGAHGMSYTVLVTVHGFQLLIQRSD
jgi:hypothetical protein